MKTKKTQKINAFKTLFTFSLSFILSLNIFSQNIQSTLIEKWDNSAWENDFKTTNTYNTNGYLTYDLTQSWQSIMGVWENLSQTNYTNNGSGLVTQQISQSWDSSSSAWENATRSTYTYTGASKIATITTDFWVGVWQPFVKITNTYDSSNYLIVEVTQNWDFLSNAFVNSSKDIFTNLPNGTVSQIVNQTWNTGTSNWDNAERNTYTYNSSSNLITELTEFWNAGNWVNFSKITNTYNANNKLIQSLDQNWEASTSSWINDSQSYESYNGNGDLNQIISQLWNSTTSVWVNELRITFTYNPLANTSFISKNEVVLYPNPVQNNFTIATKENAIGLKYFIIDQNGRSLLNGSILNEETNIDASQLANGIYFVKIGDHNQQSFKLIKE